MKLKEYMKEKGLTERKFAPLVGTSQQHINNIIRGKANPSLELVNIIEEVTEGKVTFKDLFNPKAPSRLQSAQKRKKTKRKE